MLIAPIIFVLFLVFARAEKAAITVKGVVLCQGKEVRGVFVELFEQDMSITSKIDSDDFLATMATPGNGAFAVTGHEDEFFKVAFYVRFTHRCDTKTGYRRITRYPVPREKHNRIYDMGFVSLDIYTEHDERDYDARLD